MPGMATQTIVERMVTELVFRGDTKELDRVERRVRKLQDGMQTFGRGMMVAGAGLSAALFSIGKETVEFETNMNAMAAATGVAGADFDKLRKQALHLGRTTAFTAAQAAEAQKLLGQAGFSTNKILEAMPDVLNLAAAGQLDMATSAQIMTSTLAGFGLEGKDATRVADVFASAAASAKTTVYDMGRSLVYVAPLANELGVSLESVSAASALLQDKGMRTEMTGTALKIMFSRLIDMQGPAAQAVEGLGLAISDVTALMKKGDWKSALQMLKTAGMDVVDAQKIFGMEGFNAALMLGNDMDRVIELEQRYMDSLGESSRMAERQMQGLPGAIKLLQSQIGGLKIALADAGITDAIIAMAKAVGGLIDWFQELNPIFQRITAILIGAGPVLIGVGAAMQGIAWAIGPLVPLVTALSGAIGLLTTAIIANPIGAVIAGIVAAIILLWAYWDEWVEFWKSSFEKLQMWLLDNDMFVPIAESIQWIKELWLSLVAMITDGVQAISGFFGDLLPDWMKPDISVNDNRARGREEPPAGQDPESNQPEIQTPRGLITGSGLPPEPTPLPGEISEQVNEQTVPGLVVAQAQERTGTSNAGQVRNPRATVNNNIEVQGITVNAPGGDSKEIAQNIQQELRDQIQGVNEDQDSPIAK